MVRRTTPAPGVTGAELLACLRKILERVQLTAAKVAYPGEGDERPFRHWLAAEFLKDTLRWPAESVVVGERFDIRLLDAEGFPVVTIETKPPGGRVTGKARGDFRDRLSGFGTLRTAYFTDGFEWDRLDIFFEAGKLQERAEFELALSSATDEEAEAFFAPLAVERYFGGRPGKNRLLVGQIHPHILHAFAADLDSIVSDFASFFRPLFEGLRTGEAGPKVAEVTLALFDMWCEKSLLVPPNEAVGRLKRIAKQKAKEQPTAREYEALLNDLGLPREGVQRAAENLARLSRGDRAQAEALRTAVWRAYEQALGSMAAQTAHVVLGRALLYRIAEDQKVFPVVLSGAVLEEAFKPRPPELSGAPAAVEILARVRSSMESFLPSVYMLGEFDWWLVSDEKRAALSKAQKTWLRDRDREFERALERMLRTLDGYSFERVDVDVWRNVYQDYLPEEERQRLGGFYTHDVLVRLVLDLCQFTSETEGLCSLSFLDPACGSGAFISGALGRLLKHLSLDMPCHADLNRKGLPAWKRAESVVSLCAERLHAVDIHPFAAFLTTINAFFLLLPHYVQARRKDPEFSVDLRVFSADSLEKADADLLVPGLFAKLNARVQLTEDSYHRYQEMLATRFDRIFGNPPWGGVLKGRLAPVYDTGKKSRFDKEYRAAATGKYDVYGLFMERALQVLRPGGRFGLVTQDTFTDKEWARGLRELLSGLRTTGPLPSAVRGRVSVIMDLNPFGQLFFHAMNTPCITVTDAVTGGPPDDNCLVLLSGSPEFPRDTDERQRREFVDETVRTAIGKVRDGARSAVVGFAKARRVPLRSLRELAAAGWNLDEPVAEAKLDRSWPAAELLEMRQGVTPGACLEVFLLSAEQAAALELESALVHRAIKSKKLVRWRVEWHRQVLFYPYLILANGAAPAFTLELAHVRDGKLRDLLRRADLADVLDFDRPLDDRERDIVKKRGLHGAAAAEMLNHRLGLRLVAYPNAAEYLVKHYEQLEGRVFKHKNIRQFGRQWYEYLWPRDARIMLRRDRIVSPTLIKAKEVRFALDTYGYLSDHACLYLQPTAKTRIRWEGLHRSLSEHLGRSARERDGLKYCLAFLNSPYAQARLTTGRPTPKGSYAVTEEKLRRIPIPGPRVAAETKRILELVEELVSGRAENVLESERELAELTDLARYR